MIKKLAILFLFILMGPIIVQGQTKDYAISDPGLASSISNLGNKHALVIGIENKLNPLIWAVDDAVEIGWILKNRYGFDVTCAITKYPSNPDRIKRAKHLNSFVGKQYTDKNGILNLFDKIEKKAENNDQVLIYFSCHGKPDRSSKEVGYLIPYNGDLKRPSPTLINMNELATLSKRLKARHALFILDSCYSGIAGAFSSMSPNDPNDYLYEDVQRLMGSKARHIITAGKTHQKAKMLPDKQMSAFSFYLKRGLESEAGYSRADSVQDGIILVSELQAYLQTKMLKDNRVNHDPCFFNFSEDSGEFVFVPQGEEKKPAAAFGRLKVLSDPRGAQIVMEGKPMGTAPVEIVGLAPATYLVTARLGNKTRKKQVTVRDNRKALVTFSFDSIPSQSGLYVIAQPKDSRVRILNIPEKYYRGIPLQKGRYKLEVSSPGYETKTQWVSISSSEGMDVYVELRALAPSPEPEIIQSTKPSRNSSKKVLNNNKKKEIFFSAINEFKLFFYSFISWTTGSVSGVVFALAFIMLSAFFFTLFVLDQHYVYIYAYAIIVTIMYIVFLVLVLSKGWFGTGQGFLFI